MSKTKEELNKIKEEVETVNEKLAELTEEEIAQINEGIVFPDIPGGVTAIGWNIPGDE